MTCILRFGVDYVGWGYRGSQDLEHAMWLMPYQVIFTWSKSSYECTEWANISQRL